MAIHKDFADWYRAASLTPAVDLLEARWRGVEAAAGALNALGPGELLRLHARQPQAGYKAPEFLDAAFRREDASFPNRDNTEELRVLAGAILRQVFEANGPLAVISALGLVSSSFGSRRQTVATPDHVR